MTNEELEAKRYQDSCDRQRLDELTEVTPFKDFGELFEPEKMPFNLQGETLQNEANNEGKARAQAQAAADQRKAQPELWTRCPNHRTGGATYCPRGGAALQIWQRKQWGD